METRRKLKTTWIIEYVVRPVHRARGCEISAGRRREAEGRRDTMVLNVVAADGENARGRFLEGRSKILVRRRMTQATGMNKK